MDSMLTKRAGIAIRGINRRRAYRMLLPSRRRNHPLASQWVSLQLLKTDTRVW